VDASPHRPTATLVLALLLATGCATTSGARPEQPKVVDLKIRGASQLPESDIKEHIVTSETPWWEPINPFVPPNYFDPNAWQADLRRIERYYQAQGYYQAEVLAADVEQVGPRAVKLQVKVREGEPTHVAGLRVEGLGPLSPEQRARVLAELPLREGAVFLEEDWEETRELVLQRLRELGYAEAEVGGGVRVDVETQRATVDLEVEPGPRYRFGRIFVATEANPTVPPRRIIEQVQGVLRPGEYYRESALAEAQARVFRMGVFGAVQVRRGAPDRETGTVPVVVDVREAPFRSIRLGGGLGVDVARQEVRVLAEWTDRNFLGDLRQLTVGARLGYAFIPNITAAFDESDTTPHGLIFEFSTQFEQPRFLYNLLKRPDLRLQSSLTAERGLEQAYDFIGGRFRGGLAWQPHPDLTFFPAYNLELYRLTTQTEGGGPGFDQPEVPTLILGCQDREVTDRQCNISLSFLEQVVEWDRRNDALAPSRGFYAALSLQEGGAFLLGDFTFLRILPDLRIYHSFGPGERFTVAARVRLGTLLTPANEDSPIVNRFFSGGGASMRGFNSRQLSPRLAVPRVSNPLGPEDYDYLPIGGNSLLESSVELRVRLGGDLVLAAFHDSGLVGPGPIFLGPQAGAEQEFSRLFGNHHYQAVGLGLRYLTVVGPIRLDIARRLNIGAPLPVLNPTTGQYFSVGGFKDCFGLGRKDTRQEYAGSPEGLCTFFLSIGEAF